MTTGNIIRNGTYYVTGNCNGSTSQVKVGPYFQKVWNGANQPKTPKEYRNLRDPKTGKSVKLRVFRKRQLIPLPYSCTIVTDILPLFEYQAPTSGNPPSTPCVYAKRMCNAGFTTKPMFPNPWSTNDDLKLLAELHKKIWGSGFDPGVFLAEAHSGLAMIASSATRLRLSMLYAKRGQLKRAWNVLGQNPKYVPNSVRKNESNMWAEFRWGWTPLISDAYDGAQWVAHQVAAPMVNRVSARLQRQLSGTINESVNSPTYSVAKSIVRKQLIAYLKEDISVQPLNAIDPATIAWELVPYSFVFDWFVPIGNWLKARGLASKLKGTFVTSKKWTQIASGYKNHGDGVTGCPAKGAISLLQDPLYEYTTFQRTISDSLNHLTKFPVNRGFGEVASWRHAVDSVALLVQSKKYYSGKKTE